MQTQLLTHECRAREQNILLPAASAPCWPSCSSISVLPQLSPPVHYPSSLKANGKPCSHALRRLPSLPSKASRQLAFLEFIRLRLNLDKHPEGRGFHPGPPTSAPDVSYLQPFPPGVPAAAAAPRERGAVARSAPRPAPRIPCHEPSRTFMLIFKRKK